MENTKKEKEALRRYLDDMYLREEASQLFNNLRDAESNEVLSELADEVWTESAGQHLTTDLERERYKQECRKLLKKIEHKRRTWLRRMATVAASVTVLVLMALGSIHYYNYVTEQDMTFTEVTTTFGEKKQITLPDGTRLVLNSCSQIRYPERFTKDVRRVELKGEGYFRVVSNKEMPFIVTTGRFDVRVLGTCFDVKSYLTDDIVSVTVESGKVQVDLPEAMMRLGAQEQVLINTVSGEYSKRKAEYDVAVWMKGELRFNSTPIRDVAKELERVYNCQISFALDQEFESLISGEHDNKSLEAVLQSIEYISGVKYKKEGSRVLFYK